MGESDEDIVDVALASGELEPDSVPANFLIPFKGTPVGWASFQAACPAHTLEAESAQRAWPVSGRLAARSASHCAVETRYSSLPLRMAALGRSSREIVDGDRRSRSATMHVLTPTAPHHHDLLPFRKNTGISPTPGTVRSMAYRQRDGTGATQPARTRRKRRIVVRQALGDDVEAVSKEGSGRM